MSGHGTPRVPPTVPASAPSGAVVVPFSWVLPTQVYLASQVLPGAGAFLDPAFVTIPRGTKRVTFWITYTRGGAAGAPALRISFRSSTGIEARSGILDLSTLTAVQPNGEENFYLESLLGPQPADGNPITYQLTFLVPADANGVQMDVAEDGNTGSPGTIAMSWSADALV